jgi:hypothetical protein
MPIPSITREAAEDLISAVEDIMGEGFQYPGLSGDPSNPGAVYIYAKRESVSAMTIRSRLKRAKELYGMEPRQEAYRPAKAQPIFEVDGLPWDGEPDAEELIARLAQQHRTRSEHHHAAKLRQVRVLMDGPVALAGFGDPHIDDPGCAWGDLERDVKLCRDTPGIMAVNVGDSTNNWVGRLMRLYADQEVTSKQALTLIEWLMTALPWLVDQTGNHDCHDMETEALTGRGWLKIGDIRPNDTVLSLDPAGNASWTSIIERIRRANTDQMVTINSSVVSLNVTPNHRVLHRKRLSTSEGPQWAQALDYVHADSLPCRFALPVSAPSGLPELTLLSDAQIALTGWFLTDGGVSKGRVTFYQSKDAPDLEAALAGCGYTPRVTTRQRDTSEICGRPLVKPPLPSREYVLNREQSEDFLRVAEGKGVIPSWVFGLSDRQFEVFLGAVIAGDGSWAGNDDGNAAVVHGTEAFLSSLQAACVAHGWGAHLSVARDKDYRLNVCRRREWQAERAVVVTRSEPSPEVWCLRVPHGNFMVRRNGKAHFSGNSWNTEKGDPSAIIHRLLKLPGIRDDGSNRLRLALPSGAEVFMHVRHDFPGGSQFNPAHALVRETLFGFRDHILMCGHRHSTGYIPVFHNDPRRLCHGFRLGTYKDFDHYAAEKGFQDTNWARSMGAVINPDHADDPTRFIKPFFNLEEMAEYLTWRRGKWEVGKSAA